MSYKSLLVHVDVDGENENGKIHILHESSERLYKTTLDTMAIDAKKEVDNFFIAPPSHLLHWCAQSTSSHLGMPTCR